MSRSIGGCRFSRLFGLIIPRQFLGDPGDGPFFWAWFPLSFIHVSLPMFTLMALSPPPLFFGCSLLARLRDNSLRDLGRESPSKYLSVLSFLLAAEGFGDDPDLPRGVRSVSRQPLPLSLSGFVTPFGSAGLRRQLLVLTGPLLSATPGCRSLVRSPSVVFTVRGVQLPPSLAQTR